MAVPDLAPRHLGRGLYVHPLGVNCGAIGASADEQTPELNGQLPNDERYLHGLRRAVEHGATLVDTADAYGQGHSERVVGQLLREQPAATLQVSSKVGRLRGSAPHPYADRHIHHQFQQTLENLYIEELDVYILDSFDFGPDDRYLDTAIEQMRTLRQLGLTKAIGMRGPYASYGASPAERAAQSERFLHLFHLIRPDVIWTRFNALTPAISIDGEDLFTFTARRGTGVILAAPLAHGFLTGKTVPRTEARLDRYGRRTTRTAFTPRIVEAIDSGLQLLREYFGDAPGTLPRLALRSCLQRADHCAVVVGFRNEVQVSESFRCLGAALTDTELGLLDEVYAQMRANIPDAAQPHFARGTRA
ncbi:aldo/keto reductase [Streptomyces sp. NPDC057654]|uniref:aldo/keto reductase n=1 Tax=Streptomyces sp. NPDC057654 TaxID=3346196 RepID=UPI0036A299D7